MLQKGAQNYRNSVILITNSPDNQMRVPVCQFYSHHCLKVPPHTEQVWFTLWSCDSIAAWIILQSGSLNNACVFKNACCKLIRWNTSWTHIWHNICPLVAYPASRHRQKQFWSRVPGAPKTKMVAVECKLLPMSSTATYLSQLLNVYREQLKCSYCKHMP